MSQRILVADDSAITRRFIRQDLQDHGYVVTEVRTGAEAMRSFREQVPNLVTLGVELPDLSGYEVCGQMREWETGRHLGQGTPPLVPVLFVTGNDTQKGRELGFAAGATDFIAKPFPRGSLLERVRTILQPAPLWRNLLTLVVDDSVVTRRVLCDALKRLGVEVMVASNGEEALELLQASGDAFDLVLSDLHMPGMGGDELCRRMRGELGLNDLPFIIVSADSGRESILDLFATGATDYLLKPFSVEELFARVEVHLKSCLLARDLAGRNRELEDDLRLAQEVQQATLFRSREVPFLSHSVRYLPNSGVSGDVYDFSIGAEGHFNVFLGDATGHGVGAAFMTMMVQAALDSIGPDLAVDETLSRLHRQVFERTQNRFVTGIYARIAPNGAMQISSAGHPPAVLVPGRGEPRFLDPVGGIPLGMLENPIPFTDMVVPLEPGDRLFLYTDGLTEWANAVGDEFGAHRLMNQLASRSDAPLEAVVDGAVAAARAFSHGTPCPDDITLVGLEFGLQGE